MVGAVTLPYVRTNCWPLPHEWLTVIVLPEIAIFPVPVSTDEQVALETRTYAAPLGVAICGVVQTDGTTTFTLELAEKA